MLNTVEAATALVPSDRFAIEGSARPCVRCLHPPRRPHPRTRRTPVGALVSISPSIPSTAAPAALFATADRSVTTVSVTVRRTRHSARGKVASTFRTPPITADPVPRPAALRLPSVPARHPRVAPPVQYSSRTFVWVHAPICNQTRQTAALAVDGARLDTFAATEAVCSLRGQNPAP